MYKDSDLFIIMTIFYDDLCLQPTVDYIADC